MLVRDLELRSVDELKPFIAKCDFLPFGGYVVGKDSIASYIVQELSDIISRGGSCLVAEEQGEIVGLISSERSDWDSSHFGVEISKIVHLLATGDYFGSFAIKQKLVSQLTAKSCKNLLLHISARVLKEDLASIHALESKCFRLMDVLVTYVFNMQKQKRTDLETGYRIRQFSHDEIHELSEITLECFGNHIKVTDHFHADPTLPREKSDLLYVKWLIDSCFDPDSVVLVAEKDGKPVGFNVCRINKPLNERLGIRLGTIALTAVKPSERRKFVATSMLNASLAWFADKVDFVETGGQVSNFAVQSLWTKLGFNMMRSQCTFHWSVFPDSR